MTTPRRFEIEEKLKTAINNVAIQDGVGNARAFHPGSRYRARREIVAPVGRSPGKNCLEMGAPQLQTTLPTPTPAR